MRISNVHLLMSTIINNIGDPLGAKITRWVTYERFLDAPIGSEADPDKYRKDLYQIERKVSQDEAMVEFELSAAIDQDGRQLPGRQVVRGFCNHRYRVFTGPTLADPAQIFSYDNATCPYTGDGVAADDGPYFTQSGLSATGGPIEDVCGKKLSDCKLRFTNQPTPLPLPFRGFPAVDRIRVD
jgi:lambda family phage minor tail protein L